MRQPFWGLLSRQRPTGGSRRELGHTSWIESKFALEMFWCRRFAALSMLRRLGRSSVQNGSKEQAQMRGSRAKGVLPACRGGEVCPNKADLLDAGRRVPRAICSLAPVYIRSILLGAIWGFVS